MIRHIRNLLYFVIGFLLAINSGLALAVRFDSVVVMTRDSAGRPVTLSFDPGPGGVNVSGNHSRTVNGGAVPVNSPVTVTQKIPGSAIADLAKKAARVGIPGVAAGIVIPMLVEAGIECLQGGDCRLIDPPSDPWGDLDQIPATYGDLIYPLGYRATTGPSTVYASRAEVCASRLAGNGNPNDYPPIPMVPSGTQCSPSCANAYTGNVLLSVQATCFPGQGSRQGSCPNDKCVGAKGYFCPSGQSWTLSGDTCYRTSCTENEYRDQNGTCQPKGLSDAELERLLQDVADTYNATEFVKAVSAAGHPIPAETPIVSGPESVTSDPITKQSIRNGETLTTTTTTTVNNTYNNNTVTSTVTNNSVTTNQAGQVVEQTSEQVPQQIEDDAVSVSDTPLGDIPKLYERKYPDGLIGVWLDRKAELMATPLFGLSATFAPSIGSGSCPSWSFSVNIPGIANFGTYDVAPPCWLWPMLKVVIIVTALLTARRLIFGG